MNVLLSIKLEFAEKILSNEKRYEFRKTGFRNSSAIDKVIRYSSSPVQRIVGFFTVDKVVATDPEALWGRFGDESGIEDKERFMDYYTGKEKGYAIKVDEVHRLPSPVDPKEQIEEFRPPGSFRYTSGELESLLEHYSPLRP